MCYTEGWYSVGTLPLLWDPANPNFPISRDPLLAGADPMTMTIVEEPTVEFPFWFITQRGPFAADLILLWASSGGLGAIG